MVYTADAQTTVVPTWEMAVILGVSVLCIILFTIIAFSCMIYCQLTTPKRLRPKHILARTDCASICCVGMAARLLTCCCCCDPRVKQGIEDEAAEPLYDHGASAAGLMNSVGGNTLNLMQTTKPV